MYKPNLRSMEPVLWSILRSDPRSTPWSIPNGFAHTLTHMYIPPHPCSMAMISHPCTICALDVLRIILSHSCITICVFLYVCVCPYSPASSQQCSSRCSQGERLETGRPLGVNYGQEGQCRRLAGQCQDEEQCLSAARPSRHERDGAAHDRRAVQGLRRHGHRWSQEHRWLHPQRTPDQGHHYEYPPFVSVLALSYNHVFQCIY